ncbi:MAG: DUF1738 domain-containing protein [Williamsia sp.]|nr:DUF1738 domain-containing protein [Williamsia sp.]
MQNASQNKIEFKQNRNDLYQQITDTIIKQLEAGTVPWQKPWIGKDQLFMDIPKNFVTGNHYRGINILLLWGSAMNKGLTTQEWASFKQWSQKGERINKGEKGTLIVYYDTIEKEVDGEIEKIPFLKSSFVFNRCQLESYAPEETKQEENPVSLVERLEHVEAFIGNTKAIIEHNGYSAHYNRSEDKINMPLKKAFVDRSWSTATESYYAVLSHELIHWSGSANRLDRTKGKKFGDQNYATEELIAELGAAFLCAELGISLTPSLDRASYISHWLEVLRNDGCYIISAASQASKAVDYLKGLQP